jgi:periplasmic divalent cation tolerance protein
MYNVIFITCANNKEAEGIAKALVENKLVACVNILDKIKSVFWWQGKVEQAREALLIIKTKRSKLTRIIKLVRSLHSYDVPEIIALPIIGGYKPYLKWIDASISRLA